jgi:hypothetical protein
MSFEGIRTRVAFGATLLLANAAAAHPGHGVGDGGGWLHVLSEPLHAAPLAALAAACAVAWRVRRAMRARPR